MRKLNTRQLIRFIVILALGSLFIGSIAYSARSVRYKVDGVPTTEFTITKLSLTHSIECGKDGKLTNPYADQESMAAQNGAGPRGVMMAANTSSSKKVVASKKTAPKKQVSQKPAKKKDNKKQIKKPAKKTDTKKQVKKPTKKSNTKKPADKPSKKPRPGAGKACPT